MTERHNVTLDDLAGMVKDGFDGVTKQFEGVNARFDALEQGQEDIKLRLDNVAYRFELVELQKRVQVLEQEVTSLRSR